MINFWRGLCYVIWASIGIMVYITLIAWFVGKPTVIYHNGVRHELSTQPPKEKP